MTLIVEDGTIVAGAESYNTLAEITTYHANRGNAAWALLTSTVQEQCARKATDYLAYVYKGYWKGVLVIASQSLDYPRDKVYLEATVNGSNLLASTVIPSGLKNAHAELSLIASTEVLLPAKSKSVRKKTIGPLTTEYEPLQPNYKKYSVVDSLLRPYLKAISGRVIH
jgi:hypothetical protein